MPRLVQRHSLGDAGLTSRSWEGVSWEDVGEDFGSYDPPLDGDLRRGSLRGLRVWTAPNRDDMITATQVKFGDEDWRERRGPLEESALVGMDSREKLNEENFR